MSLKRTGLNVARQRKHLACLLQMRAEGLPVEIPEAWRSSVGLEVWPSPETCIFDLPDGRAGYRCEVHMLAAQSLWLVDCDMRVVWETDIVLESFDDKQRMWRFGHDEFVPDNVLNNRIEQGLYLRPGRPIAGVILATGLKPIPAEYNMGSRATLKLSFYDAAWTPMNFDFEVLIRRVQYPARPIRRPSPQEPAPQGTREAPTGVECSARPKCEGGNAANGLATDESAV